MEEVQPKLTVQDVFGYLLAYMCWLLTASISMLTLLVIRNMINVLWPAMGGSKWTLRPIDRFGLVLLGLVWLVYVIFIEQHYRSSITLSRIRRVQMKTRSTPQIIEAQRSRSMRFLRKLGLDILAQRFVPTIVTPLVALAVAYLLQQLAFTLLTR